MMIDPTTRTTIALPAGLLAATVGVASPVENRAITAGKAKNCTELITRAIQRELLLIRRAEIDADLLDMAQDIEYQSEVLKLEAEFAVAQREAFQTIEAQA